MESGQENGGGGGNHSGSWIGYYSCSASARIDPRQLPERGNHENMAINRGAAPVWIHARNPLVQVLSFAPPVFGRG